ncbi:hypothetical protein GCM10027444_10380 [Actinopolyspora lacussalsi]
MSVGPHMLPSMSDTSTTPDQPDEAVQLYSSGNAPEHLKTQRQLAAEHEKVPGGPVRGVLLVGGGTPLFDVNEAVEAGKAT